MSASPHEESVPSPGSRRDGPPSAAASDVAASTAFDASVRQLGTLRSAGLTGLVLVGLLTVVSLFLENLVDEYTRSDAHLINVAGRQRMLSLRTGLEAQTLAEAIAEGATPGEVADAEANLRATLSTLVDHHQALSARSDAHGLRGTNSESGLAALDGFAIELELLRAVSEDLLASARSGASGAELLEQARVARSLASAAVGSMDPAVRIFELEAERRHGSAGVQQLIVLALPLLVLVLVLVLVIDPLVRRARRQHQTLKRISDETAALHAREAQTARELQALRSAMDEHTLFSITDSKGRIIDVNAGFCRISGYSREELIGKDHRLLNSSTHSPDFWRSMWSTVLAGNSWRGEVRNRAKDGTYYWVDSTIIPELDLDGNVTRIISLRFEITAKKHVEEQMVALRGRLEEQREELKRILDAIPAFIYYKDDANTILDLNRLAAEEIGLPAEEIRGRRSEEFFPPDDAAGFLEDDLAVIRSGEPRLGIVEHHETGEGGRLTITTDKIPLRGPDGTFDRLVAIATDITEQERTKAELEELQSRFTRAVDGAQDGLFDHDLETDEVWLSSRYRQLLGYDPIDDEGLPTNLAELSEHFHPDDRAAIHAEIQRGIEENTPFDLSYRMRRRDGTYRWFSARATVRRDDRGRPWRIAGSMRDVEDQRIAETRLDLAIRAARIGLWDWQMETGETYYSDTYYTTLGYEPGELPMNLTTWESLVHEDDREQAYADIQAHVEGRTPIYRNEQRMRCKDGSWLWVRDVGEVVERDADGKATRMMGMHVDISEQRRSLDALSDALERAEQANVSKSEFLANMSHEIRTPMTAILGFTDLLESDEVTQDPVRLRETIQTIQNNGRHLLTIINDILDMSKIEAGKMLVEHVETRPLQIAEEVASLMRPRAIGKGVTLDLEYGDRIPERIESDPVRLRQILLNLVGNAIKFTESGGVTITVDCVPEAEQLVVAVRDTGIGMTPEQVEAIGRFDAFQQADSSTTRNFGGTGLGLRISHALATMLGGGIRLESETGCGSCFTVTVGTGSLAEQELVSPLAIGAAEAEETAQRSEVSEKSLEGFRILLAEDGPDNQRLISFLLRKAGATIDIVDNGRQAVDAVVGADALPDLILMDMQMPELDGYGATDEIRRAGLSLPIVALTAHAMAGDRERCLEAGCDDYATKPVDRKALIETCARWVTENRADRDDAA